MDSGIGRVLARLEAMGIRQNTIVVFTSDNGMNMGHHGIWGKGNGTFPFNMYDTSVKVPLIVSMPGTVPRGRVSDAMLSQYDWFPTILDVLGIQAPGMDALPGRSFASALGGGKDAGHGAVVIYDEYGPVRMARTRDWKYVHRYPYGPHELYDLARDPGERTNLFDRLPQRPDAAARLLELKAILDTWFTRYADPARDGSREGVTGLGQIDLAGPSGGGRNAWYSSAKIASAAEHAKPGLPAAPT